jgi:hypothetical protein
MLPLPCRSIARISYNSAGIIDGNVETTETSDGLVDETFDFVVMAHIGAYKFGLSAEVAQFSG